MLQPSGPIDEPPLMSPNCWAAVDGAVRDRPGCRYLEWGAGGSTVALVRAAVRGELDEPIEIVSIENDPSYAPRFLQRLVDELAGAPGSSEARIEPLTPRRPTLAEALGRDHDVADLEAHLLVDLWRTGHDEMWVLRRDRLGPVGPVDRARRSWVVARCVWARRWEQVQRARGRRVRATPARTVPLVAVPDEPLRPPVKLVFEHPAVRLELLVVPAMRNRWWTGPPILDGCFREFADYVLAPVRGRFDVVLVDGRARASCLKRVHRDDLAAPGGVVFVHDAHRPSHLEAYALFDRWGYVRGEPAPDDDREHSSPPLVQSGSSPADAEAVFDRELFFHHVPVDPRGQ